MTYEQLMTRLKEWQRIFCPDDIPETSRYSHITDIEIVTINDCKFVWEIEKDRGYLYISDTMAAAYGNITLPARLYTTKQTTYWWSAHDFNSNEQQLLEETHTAKDARTRAENAIKYLLDKRKADILYS